MSVRKADDFIADVERQFDWYLTKAGWEVADCYLDPVEATCQLLAQHPNLGPRGGFTLKAQLNKRKGAKVPRRKDLGSLAPSPAG